MIFIINSEDRVEYINRYAAKQVGKKESEIIGQPHSLLFPPTDSDRHLRGIRWVFRHGKALYSENKTNFLGKDKWLSTWLVPLKDDSHKVYGVLGVSRDIGEHKKLEAELHDSMEILEKRVEERTADLTASREQSRNLARQVISAQEEERQRVSRELHDEAGQVLIGLRYALDSIQVDCLDNPENLQGRIQAAILQSDLAMERIRSLAHSLHPPILDIVGINLSLKDLCLFHYLSPISRWFP